MKTVQTGYSKVSYQNVNLSNKLSHHNSDIGITESRKSKQETVLDVRTGLTGLDRRFLSLNLTSGYILFMSWVQTEDLRTIIKGGSIVHRVRKSISSVLNTT